jgi:hypothetical protein
MIVLARDFDLGPRTNLGAQLVLTVVMASGNPVLKEGTKLRSIKPHDTVLPLPDRKSLLNLTLGVLLQLSVVFAMHAATESASAESFLELLMRVLWFALRIFRWGPDSVHQTL